jgi:hypothetical protein
MAQERSPSPRRALSARQWQMMFLLSLFVFFENLSLLLFNRLRCTAPTVREKFTHCFSFTFFRKGNLMKPLSTSDSRRKTAKVTELLPLRSIPLNKSALAELASNYAGFMRSNADKFLLLVAIKAAEEYLKALKAAIMQGALAHAEAQRANGIHATETGVKFSVRLENAWDFSRDAVHRQLQTQLDSTKSALKAREEFLKKLVTPIQENGVDVLPPVISEKHSSLAITLPA